MKIGPSGWQLPRRKPIIIGQESPQTRGWRTRRMKNMIHSTEVSFPHCSDDMNDPLVCEGMLSATAFLGQQIPPTHSIRMVEAEPRPDGGYTIRVHATAKPEYAAYFEELARKAGYTPQSEPSPTGPKLVKSQ